MKRYSHLITVCFSVENEWSGEQTENITNQELLEAMAARLAYLQRIKERA